MDELVGFDFGSFFVGLFFVVAGFVGLVALAVVAGLLVLLLLLGLLTVVLRSRA